MSSTTMHSLIPTSTSSIFSACLKNQKANLFIISYDVLFEKYPPWPPAYVLARVINVDRHLFPFSASSFRVNTESS